MSQTCWLLNIAYWIRSLQKWKLGFWFEQNYLLTWSYARWCFCLFSTAPFCKLREVHVLHLNELNILVNHKRDQASVFPPSSEIKFSSLKSRGLKCRPFSRCIHYKEHCSKLLFSFYAWLSRLKCVCMVEWVGNPLRCKTTACKS